MKNYKPLNRLILLKYIIRNLGRKKKQTCFTVLCILISSFIVFSHAALVNGVESRLKESINDVMSGQLMVYSSDNDKINILESQLNEQKVFGWNSSDKENLQAFIPNVSINQRIRLGALISFNDETSYVNFHALESDHIQRINRMLTMRQGRMPKENKEIVICETMADDIKCTLGDTILLVANNTNDYMSDAIGIVAGIFEEKGLAIYLTYNGFMMYDYGKEIAEVDDGNCVELVLNPTEGTDFSTKEDKEIHSYFNQNHPDLTLVSWDKTVPLLHSIANVWIGAGMLTRVVFILFSLIILIMLSSLILHSRRKEFGTLIAIGFSWNKVRWMTCTEYILISFFSVLISFTLVNILLTTLPDTGVFIASKEMQAALMTDRLYPLLYRKDFLWVLFIFTTTTILSVLISIRKIRREKVQELINK